MKKVKEANLLRLIEEYLNTQLKAREFEPVSIGADTLLIGGSLPIDSLDLATLVFELQTVTESDPFRDGFINFRTAGELVSLFQACDA